MSSLRDITTATVFASFKFAFTPAPPPSLPPARTPVSSLNFALVESCSCAVLVSEEREGGQTFANVMLDDGLSLRPNFAFSHYEV